MIRVLVLDHTLSSRKELHDWLYQLTNLEVEDTETFPPIDLEPISIEELRFRQNGDVCIVGSELLKYDIKALSSIRDALPDTPILALLPVALQKLSFVEQVVRLGANDVLDRGADARILYQKLIVLARRQIQRKRGNLIVVDSAKGGSGVTSIAAALGDIAANAGRKVCLLDFDFETQDLSRFLQARPFVNDNFVSLMHKAKAVSEESLSHCVNRVWGQSDNFVCLPPVPETEDVFSPQSGFARTLVRALEFLDEIYDDVIIDMGCLRGVAMECMYAHADKVLFVVQNDAASFYASVEKIARITSQISANCKLHALENNPRGDGLKNTFMLEQFREISSLDESAWLGAVPPSAAGAKWPASGGTLFSMTGGAASSALIRVSEKLGILPESPSRPLMQKLREAIRMGHLKQDGEKNISDRKTPLLLGMNQSNGAALRRALPAPLNDKKNFVFKYSISECSGTPGLRRPL